MFWERSYSVVYNIADLSQNRYGTIWQEESWKEGRFGPSLIGNALGYVDTNETRLRGQVGLFAAASEKWTLVARGSFANNVQSFIVGRGGSTANRAFSLQHNRPGAATQTPGIRIRGGTALGTNWGLDDGLTHTYWVTWDGSICLAYYDNAQGGVSVNVGTAAEEPAETILLGAVTTAAPFGEFTGLFDFCAILNQPLTVPQIRHWYPDIYAPWRPYLGDLVSDTRQHLRPDADEVAGSWSAVGGATLAATLADEDPATYARGPAPPTSGTAKVGVQDGQDPEAGQFQVLVDYLTE